MSKKGNNQQSSNRKLKRSRKRIIQEVASYGTQTINTLVREAVPIQGDESVKIIDAYNRKYQEWLKRFCNANNVKITKPLLDAYEEHILAYIQKILSNIPKTKQNGTEEILDKPDTEQGNNQTGSGGGEN